jgi:hypothetical protein
MEIQLSAPLAAGKVGGTDEPEVGLEAERDERLRQPLDPGVARPPARE